MARFDGYLTSMLDQATNEARLDGSATVEAHHLLLAIAADPDGLVLVAAGLDHAAIRRALDREFDYSLGAVGVSGSAFGVPPASPDPHRVPHPGASIRLALERCVTAGARRDLRPAHLLLGILQADHGTLPRALALAGVDRADLVARITKAMD